VFLTITGHPAEEEPAEDPTPHRSRRSAHEHSRPCRRSHRPRFRAPADPRPSLSLTLRNTVTMAARGLIKIRRTPEQLVDVTVQPILFTLMFTYIFGGAISGNVTNYLPVIILGSSCRP
jgi:hypothetical protein